MSGQKTSCIFRKAAIDDLPQIWQIVQEAIGRRAAEGSRQWQDGYLNEVVLEQDIRLQQGFVLTADDHIAGYAALMINDEPAYANIDGQWLSDGDFIVFHRLALASAYVGRGLGKKLVEHIEQFARSNNIGSVRADTNFDNHAMLAIFDKTGYHYCGEVMMRGGSRKAFEKLL